MRFQAEIRYRPTWNPSRANAFLLFITAITLSLLNAAIIIVSHLAYCKVSNLEDL